MGSSSKNVEWIGDELFAREGSDLADWLNTNFPKDNGKIFTKNRGGYIDFDYDHYGVEKVGEANFMDIFSENRSTMFDNNGLLNLSESQKRNLLWNNADLTKVDNISHHELFQLHNGRVEIYDLPSAFHGPIGHIGGTNSISIIWKQLGTNTLFLPERMVVARNIADTVLNFIF